MKWICVPAIEQQARRMRAEDLQRREAIVLPRLQGYREIGKRIACALVAAAHAMEPLFSWNPTSSDSK